MKKGARNVGEEGHEGEDSSLLSNIMERSDSLQTFAGERFDTLELQVDMRFNEMESRMTKVEEDVSYIRSSFDLPPPPPPSSYPIFVVFLPCNYLI